MGWRVCLRLRLHHCNNNISRVLLPNWKWKWTPSFPTTTSLCNSPCYTYALAHTHPRLLSLSTSSSSSSSSSFSASICSSSTQQEQEERLITSPELVALEYADLNLPLPDKELGHVRIRQHVNPLRASFSMPVQVPDWNQVFGDPTLPLMVDIGSGSGRFLMWLGKRNLGVRNYLGVEIRHKLVNRAQYWVKELTLDNVYFLFANATNSFKQLVSTYPGPLMLVSILCPDPHFKKRHHKRRVVQKPLVESILTSLMPGGQVLIQSDVFEVAVDMRNQFDAEANTLKHIDEVDSSVLCDSEGWLLRNPMGIRTEREIHAEFEGAKIYRRMYLKFK